jgi:hypothetical protein
MARQFPNNLLNNTNNRSSNNHNSNHKVAMARIVPMRARKDGRIEVISPISDRLDSNILIFCSQRCFRINTDYTEGKVGHPMCPGKKTPQTP